MSNRTSPAFSNGLRSETASPIPTSAFAAAAYYHCSSAVAPISDENDCDVPMDNDDNNSIPTTMGVRGQSYMDYYNRTNHTKQQQHSNSGTGSGNMPPPPSASNNTTTATTTTTFTNIPPPPVMMNVEDDDFDDDDISTLTEFSMSIHEDDNLSQTTANTTWTCVTEGTASTRGDAGKRKEASVSSSAPQFKRRRKF